MQCVRSAALSGTREWACVLVCACGRVGEPASVGPSATADEVCQPGRRLISEHFVGHLQFKVEVDLCVFCAGGPTFNSRKTQLELKQFKTILKFKSFFFILLCSVVNNSQLAELQLT